MAHISKNRQFYQIQYFKNDAVLKPAGITAAKPSFAGNSRGKVREFTFYSRRRLAFLASNTSVDFRSMMTLTYAVDLAPKSGKDVKKHLNGLLTNLRNRFHQLEYLWFMEFTKKGVPHFHILLSESVPGPFMRNSRGAILNLDETRKYSEIWSKITGNKGSKMDSASVCWEIIREKDGAARYCSKYAYKMEQKICPEQFCDCGRFWGASRGVRPRAVHTERIRAHEAQDSGFAGAENIHGEFQPYTIQFGKGLPRFGKKG